MASELNPLTMVTRRNKRRHEATLHSPEEHQDPYSRSGKDEFMRNYYMKKIVLEPNNELEEAIATNKRKRETPRRVIKVLPEKLALPINTSEEHEPNSLSQLSNETQHIELPTQSSVESQVSLLQDLRNSPISVQAELASPPRKSWRKFTIEDLIRMDEDSLSGDKLMKILTCSSPVWWEDPSCNFDEGFLSLARTGDSNEQNDVIHETADTGFLSLTRTGDSNEQNDVIHETADTGFLSLARTGDSNEQNDVIHETADTGFLSLARTGDSNEQNEMIQETGDTTSFLSLARTGDSNEQNDVIHETADTGFLSLARTGDSNEQNEMIQETGDTTSFLSLARTGDSNEQNDAIHETADTGFLSLARTGDSNEQNEMIQETGDTTSFLSLARTGDSNEQNDAIHETADTGFLSLAKTDDSNKQNEMIQETGDTTSFLSLARTGDSNEQNEMIQETGDTTSFLSLAKAGDSNEQNEMIQETGDTTRFLSLAKTGDSNEQNEMIKETGDTTSFLSVASTADSNKENELIQETAETTSIINPSGNNTDLKRTETVCERNESKKMGKVISEENKLNNNKSDVAKDSDSPIFIDVSDSNMTLNEGELFKDIVDVQRDDTTEQNVHQNSKDNDGGPKAVTNVQDLETVDIDSTKGNTKTDKQRDILKRLKKQMDDGYKISNVVTNRTEDCDEMHQGKALNKDKSDVTNDGHKPTHISGSGSDMSLNRKYLYSALIDIDIQRDYTTNPEDFDKDFRKEKENTRFTYKIDPDIICIDDDDDDLVAIGKANDKIDTNTISQNADQEETLTMSKNIDFKFNKTPIPIDEFKKTRVSVHKMTKAEQNSQAVVNQKAIELREPKKEQLNIKRPGVRTMPLQTPAKVPDTNITKTNIPRAKNLNQQNGEEKTIQIIDGVKVIKPKGDNTMRIEGLDLTITDVRYCHHTLEPNKTHEVKNDLSITLIGKGSKCDTEMNKRIKVPPKTMIVPHPQINISNQFFLIKPVTLSLLTKKPNNKLESPKSINSTSSQTTLQGLYYMRH